MDSRARRSLAPETSELLRQIPSVDELLRQPRMAKLAGRIPRELLVEVAREVVSSIRAEITGEKGVSVIPIIPADLEDVIAREVERILSRTLQPIINATGVVLHTNLGRAPLAPAILDELRHTAIHYSNLEYDVEGGARGKRDTHTVELLTRLTGAEDAIVVNNCAAAILVVLTALAKKSEVIVSRGELIEIGDGFRIPEVMSQSGAILREVGTTNRTRIADYVNAFRKRRGFYCAFTRRIFKCLDLRRSPPSLNSSRLAEAQIFRWWRILAPDAWWTFRNTELTNQPCAGVSKQVFRS